jgi:predicted GIY-YIG superfamily endonuclease
MDFGDGILSCPDWMTRIFTHRSGHLRRVTQTRTESRLQASLATPNLAQAVYGKEIGLDGMVGKT